MGALRNINFALNPSTHLRLQKCSNGYFPEQNEFKLLEVNHMIGPIKFKIKKKVSQLRQEEYTRNGFWSYAKELGCDIFALT